MKARLERQAAYYEGRLKRVMDGIDVLQEHNDKLSEKNQQYENYLVEGELGSINQVRVETGDRKYID